MSADAADVAVDTDRCAIRGILNSSSGDTISNVLFIIGMQLPNAIIQSIKQIIKLHVT